MSVLRFPAEIFPWQGDPARGVMIQTWEGLIEQLAPYFGLRCRPIDNHNAVLRQMIHVAWQGYRAERELYRMKRAVEKQTELKFRSLDSFRKFMDGYLAEAKSKSP